MPSHGAPWSATPSRGANPNRPDRVLIATALEPAAVAHLPAWVAQLVAQRTSLLWDTLLALPTDDDALRAFVAAWARGRPFGDEHRVRTVSWWPGATDQAWGLLAGKFARWASYGHLLALRIDARIAPDELERLYAQHLPRANGVPGSVLLSGALVRSEPDRFMEVRTWLFS